MTKIISALFVCVLLGLNAFAQTGSIKGTIITSDSIPAEFVSIALKGTLLKTTTNGKGEYEIKQINSGNYILITSFTGLETIETKIVVKENETTTIPNIVLKEDAYKLDEVIVRSSVNRYNKKTPSPTLRLNSPLIEIPQNIQVITNEILKDQQVISMSDGLIRNVSGVTKFEHWGDLYTNINTRGSQIQAFRNGFNVTNSAWGPLTEDMSFVDHIEFVKGPAGFMLSSGDPSGLYNVVTKKPTGQNKQEVSFTVGSYNLFRTAVDLDGKLSNNGKLLYRLNISAQNKQSHRPNEYNDRYVIAPVVSYQFDDKTKLTFEYNYQNANMSNVGSYYVFSPSGFGTLPVGFTALPSGIQGTKINDHSFYANLQHDIAKNWKITAQLSRFIYSQEGSSMWAGNVNPNGTYIRNLGIWDAKSLMTMGQVFLNGEFTTKSIQHKILTGVDMANKSYMADWGQSHDLDSVGAEFNPQNPNLGTPVNGYPKFDRSKPLEERAQAAGGLMSQFYSSIYIQDELGFFKNKIRLTLAGRFTNLVSANWGGKPDSAQHFTPRVGLSGSISKNLSIYALYDEAFIAQSGRLASGEKVQPITGNNMEIGIKKNWFNGKWNTTLAIYRILKNNEQKRAQGIEFDLKGTITKGLNLIANYAYTDSRVLKVTDGVTFLKAGDNIPGYSKHTINSWLTYKVSKGILENFGISAGATWLIDRTSVGESYWGTSNTQKMKDYMKVDAGLFWEKEKLKITLNIFNVLNEYLYSGAYYQYSSAYYYQTEAPRNMRLSLNYKF
ncbi:MAG: TonB-dependent receptor [Bacteroidetes bacterium]|nr:TonB-dependent receptor [Bacteroidota bacterium]